MNTRKLLAIFQAGFRLTTVLLLVLSLVVAGAGAAERQYAADREQDETAEPEQSPHPGLSNDPLSKGPGDGMAPGSRPWTEQAACLQSPLALASGHTDSRLADHDMGRTFEQVVVISVNRDHDAVTSAQVDSHLGKQFTLVGAKPSGTS